MASIYQDLGTLHYEKRNFPIAEQYFMKARLR
jgi:hypothetical protein